jgi:hypothetical protein
LPTTCAQVEKYQNGREFKKKSRPLDLGPDF